MRNYYPILQAREGEFDALSQLKSSAKELITPIIQFKEDKKTLTIDKLKYHWDFPGNMVILDSTLYFAQRDAIIDLITLVRQLNGFKVNAIPCISTSTTSEGLKELNSYFGNFSGLVAIRLKKKDLNLRTLSGKIDSLLKQLNKKSEESILIFDMGFITEEDYEGVVSLAIGCITSLLVDHIFYDIVYASGSFPEHLGEIEKNTRVILPRYEWSSWKQLMNEPFSKDLAYGDYGIKHPMPADDPFEGSASIKYTTENGYLILRGVKPSTSEKGGLQYIDHCRELIRHSAYDKSNFSYGDQEIFLCAGREDKPGNATTWVKIGQNHHFQKIVSLLGK